MCTDLWARAIDYERDPSDAAIAFDHLRHWIYGFSRNSRNRERGQDYFADQREKQEFQRLTKVFRRAPSVPPRDRRSSISSSHRVSF